MTSSGSPKDFMVQVQIKAKRVYPETLFSPLAPADPRNNQAEIDSVQNAQDANQGTLGNAINELNKRVK